MSIFRRKPATDARARLVDRVVACSAPGVNHVEIDYDPADWVRSPVVGQDRTDWVAQSVAAFAEDRGLAPDSDTCGRYRAALDAVADQPSDAMATFVTFDQHITANTVATISVLDDELMVLENGTAESFLGFATDLSRPPEKPLTVAKKFQYSGRGSVDENGRYVRVTHLHRALDAVPRLHVVGNVVGTHTKAAESIMGLFLKVAVHMDDGRVL